MVVVSYLVHYDTLLQYYKCDKRLLQNAMILLQNATLIAKYVSTLSDWSSEFCSKSWDTEYSQMLNLWRIWELSLLRTFIVNNIYKIFRENSLKQIMKIILFNFCNHINRKTITLWRKCFFFVCLFNLQCGIYSSYR